ncbi:MAG: hypothetical protein KAU06_10315 [Candidatus Marinimicrobia bacterium]|nr:hypothetical protein [Candidatus Neomarinimicrobiota bacterium]
MLKRVLLWILVLVLSSAYAEKLSIAVIDLDPQGGGVKKEEAVVLTNRLRSELVMNDQ